MKMKKAIFHVLLVTALILLEYQIVTMHDSFSFECISRCANKDQDDGPNDFGEPKTSTHESSYKNKRADKCKFCNLSAQSGASRSCM